MKYFYALVLLLLSFNSQATTPTIPATNMAFNQIDGGFFNIGLTAGNGARRLIVCKAGSAVTFRPQNGMDYTENTEFGKGQQVATGEFVVYDNAFTSFFLTGLAPATQYFLAVFEYNGSGATTEYLTSSFLTGNSFTSSTPTVQTSNASFTNITTNSVVANWTNGNGLRRLIVVREGSAVNADPVSNQSYSVNSVFGSGAQIGTGNFTVYNSSSTATAVTNLKPGTQYFFAFYEFNGSGQPQYKTPAYTSSVITRSVPTIASSNVIVSKRDGKELTLGWTNGNGQRRIIVAKQGSDITGTPVNGTDYAANPIFGNGPTLNAGEYVVYDDNFNIATISGLNPATTYFFRIYEYDGSGNTTTYLTSSFGSVSGSTITTPTVQAANISATNIIGSAMILRFSNGNGRARLIIGRKGAAVNITPQNFTVYNANADLGNGNFVASNTTDAFASIQGLQLNSTYHFAIYEFNGFNQPMYLSPAATFSASTTASLPVKLINWDAVNENEIVKLKWITSAEINSSRFEIERSADGTIYSKIATIKAAGNSSGTINYLWEDKNPLAGRSYYRLRMIDIDESSTLSAVRSIQINGKEAIGIRATIVSNQLDIVNAGNQNIAWVIVNSAGQIVKKGKVSSVNVSDLFAGKYWIKFNGHAFGFVKQ